VTCSKANHAPGVTVSDGKSKTTSGPEPFFIEAEAGSRITLDASNPTIQMVMNLRALLSV
jgi:hypothetical protein